MESQEPKLCINCIYSLSDYYAQGAYQCTHENNLKSTSLVTGRQTYLLTAEQQRHMPIKYTCGKLGDWWAEKAKVYYELGSRQNPNVPLMTGETAEERLVRLKSMLPGKKKLSHTTVEDLI